MTAESLTLHQFASSCNLTENAPHLSHYRKFKVVQVVPKVILVLSEEEYELFFKQKVLLALFRDVESAKTYPTCRKTYSNFKAFHLWNFDDVVDDEEEFNFLPQETDNKPWMFLAGGCSDCFSSKYSTWRERKGSSGRFATFQKYNDILNDINFKQRF